MIHSSSIISADISNQQQQRLLHALSFSVFPSSFPRGWDGPIFYAATYFTAG